MCQISRRQVQEVVTVRDQLEKKEQDPGLSNQSERRRSEKFATLKQVSINKPLNMIYNMTNRKKSLCSFLLDINNSLQESRK